MWRWLFHLFFKRRRKHYSKIVDSYEVFQMTRFRRRHMINGIIQGGKGTFSAVPMLAGLQVAAPLPFVPVWKAPVGVTVTPSADGLTAEFDTGTETAGTTFPCSVSNPDGTALTAFNIPVLAPPPPPESLIVDSYTVDQVS